MSFFNDSIVTAVNSSSSPFTLTQSAQDGRRVGTLIFNDTNRKLYLLLEDSTPSLSRFSLILSAGDYYETPFGYIGSVRAFGEEGIFGKVFVTEVLNIV